MDSVTRILNIAETRMRRVGYNAVSFRDIADEMGIKSASLHYHFPKKADLGVALVQRYSETFTAILSTRTETITDPAGKIAAFTRLYRDALGDSQMICLCAMLGAESSSLPESVSDEVRAAVVNQTDWLTHQYSALGKADPKASAQTTLALLQGAMILSGLYENAEPFIAAVSQIEAALKPTL
jgi:TetR/AcrR family transcriptional repressor of nem operon